MAIAPARRGGTKCRKNSPQVTVFSQSGEATMLRAGREDLFAYTNTPNTRLRRLCAVRNQTLCGGTRASRPTDGFAANRLLYRSFDRLSTLSFRVRVTLLHQLTEQNQTYTIVISSEGVAEVEKSPAVETETIVHPLPKILARGGAPPRNPLRQKRNQTYTTNPNTCPQGLPASPARRVNDFCIFRSRRR